VLVLVLVLEFDAWFWCVRGPIDLVKKVRRRSCTVTAMFPSPHDRLTHPTDLVLVLVLEFDAWFWCVRGRIDLVKKVRRRSCTVTAMFPSPHDRLTHPTRLKPYSRLLPASARKGALTIDLAITAFDQKHHAFLRNSLAFD